MKNEALIKVYISEKDNLISNLEKELKEHFGILEDFNNHNEKDFIQPILKCYDLVYHLCVSAFIERDKNNEITQVKYGYYITLNFLVEVFSNDTFTENLGLLAKEALEACFNDLSKRT